jgi:predicted DNA-binding protein YlxM (UPF0122 family)
MAKFQFQSYCWALGTTSFRTSNFNLQIERQLDLLDCFRVENSGSWKELQTVYYQFIQKKEFVKGHATNPAKDAREKTSGLVDFGLLDDERNLTTVGLALLDISRSGNFGKDNPLQISNDSFIYLKQILKMSDDRCGVPVRPYVILAWALATLGEISKDEYTYLLPLCINEKRTREIFTAIQKIRINQNTIDDAISRILLGMDNYQAALEYFLNTKTVTENVIADIGINRKSGSGGNRNYDIQFFKLYETLHKIVFERDYGSISILLEQNANILGKTKTIWRKYLFNSTVRSVIERKKIKALNDIPLLHTQTEQEFRTEFFRLIHLFKAKANLADYADLNRRYFQTTDTIIFTDDKVQLDTMPKCWINEIADKLPSIAFTKCDLLSEDISLEEIAPFFKVDEQKLYADLERLFGVKVENGEAASEVIKRERYERFNKLIDEKFDRNVLMDLLKKFEHRDDKAIYQRVTNNADIPTIFEYILGIAWYHISGRRGDVLEYMNLSLEANLLPRTHAAGGSADIVWKYEETKAYPIHALLLEATLVDNSNQRRMEMEPVSRHLGNYLLANKSKYTYCLFISTFLHPNVISDFRNRRTYDYYGERPENVVHGLKILVLTTKELRTVLERGISYDTLYSLFEAAYHSNEPISMWYEHEVIEKLNTF